MKKAGRIGTGIAVPLPVLLGGIGVRWQPTPVLFQGGFGSTAHGGLQNEVHSMWLPSSAR